VTKDPALSEMTEMEKAVLRQMAHRRIRDVEYEGEASKVRAYEGWMRVPPVPRWMKSKGEF
jgi:hypothetical protein